MKGMLISPVQANGLCLGMNHYPERMPNRWALISDFVKRYTSDVDCSVKFIFGREPRTKEFDTSRQHCKDAGMILKTEHKEMLSRLENRSDPFSEVSPDGHKAVILLPPHENCIECNSRLSIRGRCSMPLVYTKDGPKVAASYTSGCIKCKITYWHSFYERIVDDNTVRVYYKNSHTDSFLATSRRTIFETSYLKHMQEESSKGCMNFQTCSEVYNAVHEDSIRQCAETFYAYSSRNGGMELTEQRLEEGWFIVHLVQYFSEQHAIDTVDFNFDSTGKRRDLEHVCSIAMDIISTSPNEWTKHQCDVKGCKEGYVSIDGNQKVRRPMCAAPYKNIKLAANMPRVLQCCPNSPVTGGSHAVASRYCKGHENLDSNKRKRDADESVGEDIVLTINLKTLTCASGRILEYSKNLPSNDDDSLLTGCKDKNKVDRFYNRTAGIFAMVRPCGYIVDFTEMYTCESCSQVFVFLLRHCVDKQTCLNYIGYDRACEFVPFLEKMSENGNPGATLLLEGREYLVDLFHCIKHKRSSCMPLENNPDCRFHPKLEKFSEIEGVNTQCAEQSFKWLGKFKHNVRRMTACKFQFFLWCIVRSRNMCLETKVLASGKSKAD